MSGMDPMMWMLMSGMGNNGMAAVNPYSNFQSGALPPTAYPGRATNALGQQIWQAPPPPAAPAPAPAAAAAAPQYASPAPGTTLKQQYLPWNEADLTAALLGGGGMGGTPTATDPATQNLVQFYQNTGLRNYSPGTTLNQTPQAAPQPTNAGYLQALANPGRVTTPGVTPPGGPQYQPSSGVLPAMLNQWQQRGSGVPGVSLNQNFLGALRSLQGR